jgi:hypothetical protein
MEDPEGPSVCALGTMEPQLGLMHHSVHLACYAEHEVKHFDRWCR